MPYSPERDENVNNLGKRSNKTPLYKEKPDAMSDEIGMPAPRRPDEEAMVNEENQLREEIGLLRRRINSLPQNDLRRMLPEERINFLKNELSLSDDEVIDLEIIQWENEIGDLMPFDRMRMMKEKKIENLKQQRTYPPEPEQKDRWAA